jgi:dihydroneopterin aldolase
LKNLIHVNGIKLHAYHGCLEEEASVGAEYSVDVSMATDFTEAAMTDDLSRTIDYCKVYAIVKEEMAIRSKLIEQVCKRMFDRMKKEITGISHLEIKVRKHRPPIDGNVEEVSVLMSD